MRRIWKQGIDNDEESMKKEKYRKEKVIACTSLKIAD